MKRRGPKNEPRRAIERLEDRLLLAGNDTLVNAVPVSVFPAVSNDAIGQPEDVNLYKVTLTFGQTLNAHVDALSQGSTLNSYLRLFDASGNELSNSGFNFGVDPVLPAYTSLSASAVYYVGVSDLFNSLYNPVDGSNESGSSSGTYSLSLDVTPLADAGDTTSSAQGLSLTPSSPQQVPGIIDVGADSDLYQLALAEGDTLEVKIDAASLGSLDSYVRVFDAAGNQLASNDNESPGSTDSHLNFVAPSAGTYFVGVSANDNTAYDPTISNTGSGADTGDYLATLLLIKPDGDNTTAAAHSIAFVRGMLTSESGTIANGLDVDFYGLNLVAGDTLHIDNAGANIQRLRLFNAAGQQVATNDNGTLLDSGLTFTAATAGKYFVGVSAADNSTYDPNRANSGSASSFATDYQLSFEVDAGPSITSEVEPNDTPDTPNVIDNGTSVAGGISSAADADYYMVNITQAGQFTAEVAADADSQLDARMTLLSSDGRALDASDDQALGNVSPQITIHLAPGSYFLEVTASLAATSERASGDYHLSTSFVPATSPFGPHAAGHESTAIATGDFNGDGILDLVTADQTPSVLSIQFGLGDLSYAPIATVPVGDPQVNPFLTAMVAGDFNRDSKLDLAVAAYSQQDPSISMVFVLLGNGDGTFQDPTSVDVGNTAFALVSADFNHDQIPDLVVANAGDATVTLLAGQGDGTFQSQGTFGVGDGPEGLAVGDFNGDQMLDLAVANRSSGDVSILLNDSAGGFEDQVRYAVGNRPSSLASADFNGDGLTDLVVANAGSDDVLLLLGRGDGTFEVRQPIDVRGAPPLALADDPTPLPSFFTGFKSTVAVADFNHDGKADLIVAHSQDPRISVALGNGDGTFQRRAEFSSDVSSDPWDIVIGDFNGDGRLDFATAEHTANHASAFGGLGDGTFLAAARLAAGTAPAALAAADLDHDGRLDLIAGNADDASVLLGRGDGSFQDQLFAVTGHPNALAVGDFNGDGRLDVVAAGYDSSQAAGQLVVLLGLGDGRYSSSDPLNIGNFLSSIVAGDFNGDGKIDVAVASLFENSVIVLLGNGDGTFTAQPPITVGTQPTAIAAADFNDDGHVDLAVANSLDSTVSILLNDGNGGFQVQASISVGSDPVALVAADFNNDGIFDLAAANAGDGTVSLFTGEGTSGHGDGTFATAETFAAGDSPSSLVSGDFNGDHFADLAVANRNSADVSVLINDTAGGFAAQARYSVSSALHPASGPRAIAAADFNHDGILDLATANGGSQNLTVLMGAAGGTFASPDQQTSAAISAAPVLADLTGDGVKDSLVIDRSGNVLLRVGRADVSGTFAAPITVDASSTAADFATFRDGSRTLLGIVNRTGDQITLYRFSESGIPTVVSQTAVGGHFTQIVAAKLNGDSRDDLVGLDSAAGAVAKFVRSGNGFTAAGTVQVPGATGLLAVNLDAPGSTGLLLTEPTNGVIDVVAGDSSTPTAYRASAEPTGVAQPGGPGTATLPLVFDGASSIAVGDFNGDHIKDVVIAHRGTNTISVLFGKGGSALADPIELLAGSQPIAVATADFNGDHRLDLAVLNAGTHDVAIFLGDGHGSFAIGGSFDAGDFPIGLSAVDVNHDGTRDLMVSSELGDVTTLLGKGDGTFKPFRRIDRSMAIAVGDLDGDGKPDWVVTNRTRDHLIVEHEQTGTGLSQSASEGLMAPAGVRVADLDGDGIMDIVVADSGSNDVLVYLGLGNGQLADAERFFAGTSPVDVQVGDVNGDGFSDVVVTNSGSNDVSILLGTGDSTLLKPGVRLNVGQDPVSTQIGDFNSDGKPDLLVTNSASNNVMMLDGLGGGFFNDVAPTVFATGRNPTQTLIGDFDGHGVGFVTLNRDSNSLTFYSGFDSAHRRDLSSGGSDPITAVAADFNTDGLLDLIVGNGGDGIFSIFAGEQAGLSFANSFSDASLAHPAALALGQFGDGQELQLLALDEGDESVHVFGREVLLEDTPSLNSELLAVTTQSISTVFGVNPNNLTVGANLTAALAVAAIGVVAQPIDVSMDEGTRTETTGGLSLELLGGIGTAVSSGERLLHSAIAGFGDILGVKIDEHKMVETVENVVSLLFPHLPVQALPALLQNVLGSVSPKGSPSPYAVDEALETYDSDSWVDFISTDTTTTSTAPEQTSLQPLALSAAQSIPLQQSEVRRTFTSNRTAIPPTTLWPVSRAVATEKANLTTHDRGKLSIDSASTRRQNVSLAGILGAVAVGGWLCRSRRRDETNGPVLIPGFSRLTP
jgi:hypothetical protein